jgi:hypothetical protein
MGYCFVLTAEHDDSFDRDRWESYRQACIDASTSQIVIVPGIEYSDTSNTVHVLVWGNIPFLGPMRDTEHLLKRVSELKGLAVLAHPSRKDAWQRYDASWTPFLLGIEQWNRKVDGVAPSGEAMTLLNQSPCLIPFVGLDFHRANQFFPLSMTLQVEGVLCEEGALMALRERRVSPEVLGISLQHFTGGFCCKAMTATERLRRLVRKIIRTDENIPNREGKV